MERVWNLKRRMIVGMTVVGVCCALLPLTSIAQKRGKGTQETRQKRAETRRAAQDVARQTRQNVEKVVTNLDEAQRDLAAHPHDEAMIRQISLFPGKRVGVRIGDLNERQQKAMDQLLAGVFTGDALTRVREVFKQDSGSGDYYFARFWDGESTDPLTWRVEGHHFSATFVVNENDQIRPGTLLIGGRGDVWKPFDEKVRSLYASLDDDQKRKVMLAEPPRRTGNPPHADTVSKPGLAWKDLTADQRKKVRDVLGAFDGLFQEGVLNTSRRAFREAGGARTLQLVFAGDPADAKGEYHCGLSGAGGAHFEMDTRDAHVHMLLHYGDGRLRGGTENSRTQPSK